ncbi:MAG TPA: TetR/AcrR family transcriptional regulator [Solirubrobacterales bacterium]|jgi:AcrR family transcriptional regulator|nr:TetR/AcrR family transcriptional regulator [Solirubrobacterales bacterium]
MAEEELGPLPAGRHGFSREQVAHNQRERLIAGLASAVAEHGYRAVTIGHITKEAKVSRRVFYANFEGKDECFLAAFEVVVGHIRELAAEAIESIPDWPQRAVAAARAVLAFFAAEPDLARLCLVESQAAGPVVAARFHETVHEAVPLLRLGRAERERPLPETTEESVIGALVLLAGRKVAAGEATELVELLPDFTEFILAPYLGAEEAAGLARPAR